MEQDSLADDDDNFLTRFKSEDAHRAGESDGESDGAADPNAELDFKRPLAVMQSLSGCSEIPICQECGQQEGPEGGGRYGVDDHEGLFFCGKCWTSWDPNYKAEIMKPCYQQKSIAGARRDQEEDEKENIFTADAKINAGTVQKSIGAQALPASWKRPSCHECKQEEGPEGGGRYGFDDHEGLFFCGTCWRKWDPKYKAEIMKPVYQQQALISAEAASKADHEDTKDNDGEDNFFTSAYQGGEGSDDLDGAWEEGSRSNTDAQALPGSWERPLCCQCGRDEGDHGGGRYGHGPDAEKFFCGRCWQSWDEEDRQRMMRAYEPRRLNDPMSRHAMDPMLHCPPPENPDPFREGEFIDLHQYEGENMHEDQEKNEDKDDEEQEAVEEDEQEEEAEEEETEENGEDLEKRQDPRDGGWYTKQEYVDLYGGVDEWEQAIRSTETAAPEDCVDEDLEKRQDPKDGGWYSRQEYIDLYGGTDEWDHAIRRTSYSST